ncbi:MAG: hypothetical protein GX896_09205, partial [Clostridiales bacterium]|nr:hypothetical protein [Clostridiales bacterium]
MRLFRKKIYLKQKHLLVILICALVLILLIGFLIIRRIFFPKSVYFSQTSVVMYEGQKKVYGAKTEPKLPFGDNINYVSSNSKVATVSQNGTITAKSAGETEIVATHDLSKKKASLKVTVEPNTIIIDLAEDNIKILKGQTHKI